MTSVTPGVGAVTGAGLPPGAELTPPLLTLSEIQYAVVSAGSIGANTLLAGVSGSRIRVMALVLVASGGINTAQLKSDSTAISHTMDLPSDGQLILPWNAGGWCETGAGEALVLTLSAGTTVAGMLTYVLAEL